MLCDLTSLKAALGITVNTSDAQLNAALTTSNALIAAYIRADLSDVSDRTFTKTIEYGTQFLQLPVWPAISVTSISADGTALANTDYTLRKETAEVDFINVPSSGDRFGQRFTVVYKAGYATVPEDLKAACQNIAAAVYNNGGSFAGSMNGGRGELKSLTMFDAMSMSFETAAGAGADSAGTPAGMLAAWSFVLDKYRCSIPVMA